MLVSITLELWETIGKDFGCDASVPEVFCAIIQKQQQVNYYAVHTLAQDLQKMRLTDKHGQYIETFSNKMA